MKFMDPLPVNCRKCSVKAPQSVSDLLSLRAFCPACGASLAEVGQKMQASLDEVGAFFGLVEITMEEDLGITISDSELEAVTTLRQLAAIVQRHLPPGLHSGSRSVEVMEAASKRLKGKEASLDTPIFRFPISNSSSNKPVSQGVAENPTT